MTDATSRRAARIARPLLGLAVAAALLPVLSQPAAAAPRTVIHGDTVPQVKDLGPRSFTKRGPYAVGQTTIALPSNDAPVEVWYPATKKSVQGKRPAAYDLIDWLPSFYTVPAGAAVTYPSGGVRGVPVASGRFPLVVFSHGFAGFRDQSSFLTSWLASWGFVVAAPDHRNRDLTAALAFQSSSSNADIADLRETLTLMRTKTQARASRFHGHVDTTRVGAVGHSAGGSAVETWAATDKRVTTFVGLAGASAGALGDGKGGARNKVPSQPGLLMAGSSDAVVPPARIAAAYDTLRASKRLVVVGGGHHAFSDLCEIGAADGGILAIATILKIQVPEQFKRLASDGCEPPALAPTKAWPAVRQVTIAYLRRALGFDRSRAGFRGLKAAFPGVVESSRVVN
ncbi:MAG: dienelactone hydrolase family protein [Aeromicrobium sp.]